MNKDFIASIILAVGCFMFFILVMPQYDALLDIKQASQSQEALLLERKLVSDNFKTMFSQMQEQGNDIAKLSVVLPPKSTSEQVIMDINQAVSESGMQLISLSTAPSKDSKVTGFKKIGASFNVVGDAKNLPVLLNRFESSLRVYDVYKVSISKDESSGSVSSSNYTMEIELIAYYAEI